MSLGRRSILALVGAIAVLAAGLGWVAGRQIKSPGQIAAEQEPPDPSLITVPVELRTLSQNVVVRGTIQLSDETPLAVSSTVGSSVITRLAKSDGDTIDEGDVVIEVAGRPVIALQGHLPAYRNLIPGLDGPDVEQLEEALVRLGYNPGSADDTYTTETAAAVADLYRDTGYPAPETDPGLQAAVDGAESEVDAQKDAVASANSSLSEAGHTVPEAERSRLDLAVDQAEAAVVTVKAEAATAKAEASQAVTDAQTALDETRAGGDTSAIAAAERALDEAKQAKGRTDTDQDLLVADAEVAVAEAKQARTDRLSPPELAHLRDAVTEANDGLAKAQTSLTEARAAVGAWIPTTEVVFLASTPRQVSSLTVEVGDEPTGPVMSISGADTIIDSGVSAADRSLIEVGASAVLEDDDLGLSIDATVTFVADNPGGPDLSEDRYAVRLEAVDEIPEDAVGLNLRISIPITSSGGDVLAVPLAALSAGPDGTARVEVERSSGQTDLIEVTAGLRAEGYVQIEPLAGVELNEGDRVVVGRDLELPGSGDDDSSDDDSSEDEPGDDSGEDDSSDSAEEGEASGSPASSGPSS